jgi:hypothetical protein
MNLDFSTLNLQYLIQARDIARQNPTQVTVWLGLSPDLVQQLADLTPEQLARVPRIKLPLVRLRQESWWWERFFNALREGRSDEIQAIVEHLNLLAAHESGE